jgi:hypothetical protein
MGTLSNPPPRSPQRVDSGPYFGNQEEQRTLLGNGDVFDEQIAGIGELLEKIAAAIESVTPSVA